MDDLPEIPAEDASAEEAVQTFAPEPAVAPAAPQVSANVYDEYHGVGGSYRIDETTGKRVPV